MSTVEGPTWASVTVDGRRARVSEDQPLVFGRADVEEQVIGLDPRDMAISAVAGAVEYLWDVWWVHNRSTKRYLLLEEGPGVAPRRLACGDRHAISATGLTVLVPGDIATHRIVVEVQPDYLQRLRQVQPVTSGTISHGDVRLSERDRDVLTALLAGFLEPFPRYHPHPRTYAEAAARLGPPWDHNRVRKQVERLRTRLAGAGIYIEGARANYELAEFLIGNGLLTAQDLSRLDAPLPPATCPDECS